MRGSGRDGGMDDDDDMGCIMDIYSGIWESLGASAGYTWAMAWHK